MKGGRRTRKNQPLNKLLRKAGEREKNFAHKEREDAELPAKTIPHEPSDEGRFEKRRRKTISIDKNIISPDFSARPKRAGRVRIMPMNVEKVAQLERQWREAKDQLLREQGRMYEIIRRKISADEWQRIMDSLEDHEERVLFGLELPQETKKRGRPPKMGGAQTTKGEGEHTCPFCGREGFTERGLKLHITRMHSDEKAPEETGEGEEAA